jgi:two-component system, probable response regulator PhcQ
MIGRKVLIIDDDPDVLDCLDSILSEEGYAVEKAHGSHEALEIIETFFPEIVLSDYMMPGMCGVELLHKIKEQLPNIVPILITGHADLKISIGSINQGEIYRFLLKPWHTDELKMTIRTAFHYHDVLLDNERLTNTVKQQSSLLEDIEKKYPGITSIQTEEDGTILLEDEDFSDALQTLHVEEEKISKKQ